MIANFFSEGCNPVIDDFNDKYTKNTFLPPVTSPAVKNLTNFTITWIQSWDPVRKVMASNERKRKHHVMVHVLCEMVFT